ncbi:unannotated protein [freshwater metagenome]|uniref:Unannotated protein n=1 Tax=freshwater metagenome TaxID=449393 RepID=A0A6J6USD1_9ZZZZ
MTFREGVVGELHNDIEEFLAQLSTVTEPIAAGFKCLALLLHQLGNLFCTSLTEVVCLRQ